MSEHSVGRAGAAQGSVAHHRAPPEPGHAAVLGGGETIRVQAGVVIEQRGAVCLCWRQRRDTDAVTVCILQEGGSLRTHIHIVYTNICDTSCTADLRQWSLGRQTRVEAAGLLSHAFPCRYDAALEDVQSRRKERVHGEGGGGGSGWWGGH